VYSRLNTNSLKRYLALLIAGLNSAECAAEGGLGNVNRPSSR
jgi:hypothetical protein